MNIEVALKLIEILLEKGKDKSSHTNIMKHRNSHIYKRLDKDNMSEQSKGTLYEHC